jgi:regulator of RNase E activity RraA
VSIRPGDILFGDIDGVLVIPAEAEKETFALALEKVRGERTVRKALEEGVSAAAAFRTYGIM